MKYPKSLKKVKSLKSLKKIKRKSKSRSRVRIPITHPGGLHGYHVDLLQKQRRRILHSLLSKRRATYSELIKRLNVLYIYNKNRHPSISKRVKRDINYIQKKFQKRYSLTYKRRHTLSKRRRSTKRRSYPKRRRSTKLRRSTKRRRSTKLRS